MRILQSILSVDFFIFGYDTYRQCFYNHYASEDQRFHLRVRTAPLYILDSASTIRRRNEEVTEEPRSEIASCVYMEMIQ